MSNALRPALLIFLALMLSALAMRIFWGNWATDLTGLWLAGYFFDQGQYDLIYAAPEHILTPDQIVPEWAEALKDVGYEGRGALPYLYPPLWAALMAPLTRVIGPQAFMDGLFLLHLLMLLSFLPLAWRITAPKGISLFKWCLVGGALFVLSVPLLLSLLQNQPQITVTFLTLLAFERLRAGRPVASGGILAVATALKLAPLLFVLIYLYQRNWRAVGAFAIIGGALGLASLLVAGWPLHHEFLSRLSELSDRTVLSNVNFSLKAVLLELTQTLPPYPLLISLATPGWIDLVVKLILAVMIGIVFAMTWQDREGAAPRQIAALSIALFLCGPLSWAHYFLLPMSFIPLLLMARSGVILVLLAAGILFLPVQSMLGGFSERIHIEVLFAVLLWLVLFAAMVLARSKNS